MVSEVLVEMRGLTEYIVLSLPSPKCSSQTVVDPGVVGPDT